MDLPVELEAEQPLHWITMATMTPVAVTRKCDITLKLRAVGVKTL